jgi:hypothetical protein
VIKANEYLFGTSSTAEIGGKETKEEVLISQEEFKDQKKQGKLFDEAQS